MSLENIVTKHYSNDDLEAKIYDGFKKKGIARKDITVEDLAIVDEFHIGGVEATSLLIEKLPILPSSHLLDIGCGIGGPARYIANSKDCKIDGIDITADYIKTGNGLTKQVGLSNKVYLTQGSALNTPFQDQQFDVSYMMHVGMNISDKNALMKEVFRVTKSGGIFGIYDVILTGHGDMRYPVPWSESESGSAISTSDTYKEALKQAGFNISYEKSEKDFALTFFNKMLKDINTSQPPPALGLHLLMGPNTQMKIKNMAQLVFDDVILPTFLIATK